MTKPRQRPTVYRTSFEGRTMEVVDEPTDLDNEKHTATKNANNCPLDRAYYVTRSIDEAQHQAGTEYHRHVRRILVGSDSVPDIGRQPGQASTDMAESYARSMEWINQAHTILSAKQQMCLWLTVGMERPLEEARIRMNQSALGQKIAKHRMPLVFVESLEDLAEHMGLTMAGRQVNP